VETWFSVVPIVSAVFIDALRARWAGRPTRDRGFAVALALLAIPPLA
jgi:hypothetical protein